MGDADVFAVAEQGGQIAVQVFFFRGGSNFGNRTHFPMHGKDVSPATVLGAFISQFYDTQAPPATLLLNEGVPDMALLAEALSIKVGRRVAILIPQRGERRRAGRRGQAKAALAAAFLSARISWKCWTAWQGLRTHAAATANRSL